MNDESKKNKRKKSSNKKKKSDKNKEKQVNTKPEGDNQTEKEKIEAPENSEAKICLAAESDEDDGGSRTSKKINAASVSEPEIAREMEDNSGSCDSKMLTDDKHIDNKEVKICSQTTGANGANADDSKTDKLMKQMKNDETDERQASVSEARQKVKKYGPASYDRKVNDIRQWVSGYGQSTKTDTKDPQLSRGGQWSSMRGRDSRQDRPHNTSVQSNMRVYVKRTHSAEKSEFDIN